MPTYRIRINRGDTHFEAEGDKKFVLDMLARFESRTFGGLCDRDARRVR